MTARKAIALILVLALLAAGVWYLRRVEKADQMNMRDLYSAVEPLQREREALAAERDKLETDYALQMRDAGTIELLFREMNKRIFSEVYPLMRDRGVVGVLGVSPTEYPGLMSKLTLEQYSRLLMDGWGSCYLYDSDQDLATWLNATRNLLEHDKLALPTAIFFSNASYSSEMDDTLTEFGIQTVIVSIEDGHSATVSPVGDGFWFTGAMPWNYTGVSRDTELLARTNGSNLVFTISFNSLWDAFERDAFTKVLENWKSMLVEEDILQELIEPTPTPAAQADSAEDALVQPLIRVTTVETARDTHETAAANNALLEKELAKRQSELDKQLADLDEQIRELYDQWSSSGKKTAPGGA